MPLANPFNGEGQVYMIGSPAQPNGDAYMAGTTANRIVIDGTPVRVVVLALAAAAGLTALRWAGFKFNIGVSA